MSDCTLSCLSAAGVMGMLEKAIFFGGQDNQKRLYLSLFLSLLILHTCFLLDSHGV